MWCFCDFLFSLKAAGISWKLSDLTADFCHRPGLLLPALVHFTAKAQFISNGPIIMPKISNLKRQMIM